MSSQMVGEPQQSKDIIHRMTCHGLCGRSLAQIHQAKSQTYEDVDERSFGPLIRMTGTLKQRLHHQCDDDADRSKTSLESGNDEQSLQFFDESAHEHRGKEPHNDVDLSHEFLEQLYSFIENVGTHGFQDAADREVVDEGQG